MARCGEMGARERARLRAAGAKRNAVAHNGARRIIRAGSGAPAMGEAGGGGPRAIYPATRSTALIACAVASLAQQSIVTRSGIARSHVSWRLQS